MSFVLLLEYTFSHAKHRSRKKHRKRKEQHKLRITRTCTLVFWVSLCFPYLEKHQIKRMWLKTTEKSNHLDLQACASVHLVAQLQAEGLRSFKSGKVSSSSRSTICFYWLVLVWIIYYSDLRFIRLTFGLPPKNNKYLEFLSRIVE